MPDRSAIPRNFMRIYLRDYAGEAVEDKLFITKGDIDPDTLLFPELIMDEKGFSVKGYEEAKICLYSGSDKLLYSGSINEIPMTFNEIFGKDRSELAENIKFNLIVNTGDLLLESGPWY